MKINTNILNIFENTVKEYRSSIFIEDESLSLSYLDTLHYSKSFALKISEHCKTGEPVAVFIDRSVYSIVGILSVLYSNNFYVPVDPSMPKEKILTILDEIQSEIIIVPPSLIPSIEALELGRKILQVELEQNITEPAELYNEDNMPLYMVYTSGSTGKPKGVLKSHQSMISFVKAYIDKFKFDNNEVIGNQSPFFFDAAAKDLYLAMFTGAKIVIIPTKKFAAPYSLIEYLNEKRVTFISWVPSMLSIIVQINTFNDILPTTLKKVFFVGESFPIKYLRKWIEALPNIKYVNLFGSSEISGIFSYYEINKLDDDLMFLPIGKPLSNCNIILVDDDRVVTENDELGEMMVSSDACALCYYNDEEKTKEKFITTDKFDGFTRRYFCTGDIAKKDKEGNLVFVSRKDFQIKKMGHRIELGEIESIANKFNGIEKSCCVYLEDKKQIIIYCQANEKILPLDIKAFLKDNLTDYMMPSKIIVEKELPLNANGKINRALLKEMLTK